MINIGCIIKKFHNFLQWYLICSSRRQWERKKQRELVFWGLCNFAMVSRIMKQYKKKRRELERVGSCEESSGKPKRTFSFLKLSPLLL